MNRLILIGNGFDLAHDLKTSYKDFINWYWDQVLEELFKKGKYSDTLCNIELTEDEKKFIKGYSYMYENYKSERLTNKMTIKSQFREYIDKPDNYRGTGIEAYDYIKIITSYYDIKRQLFSPNEYPLMARIMKSVKEKKWVDIEKDYYELLKETLKDNCKFTAKLLNEQLHFLQEKLVEYLKTLHTTAPRKIIEDYIKEGINFSDICKKDEKEVIASVENIFEAFKKTQEYEELKITFSDKYMKKQPQNTVLLNFNYTSTTLPYKDKKKIYRKNHLEEIHIHGSLKEPENIIFGYGDEQDKNYNEIIEKDDNDLLENIKNLKYSNNSEYNRLMNFLNSDYFQVYIMGHSCGNSDRTLLHTIFEHENCVSIKPFYHEWEEKIGDTEETHIVDNYQDIYANIYRDFENKETCRSKVVPKERCEPLK